MKHKLHLFIVTFFALGALLSPAHASYTARMDNPNLQDPEHLNFQLNAGDTITEYLTIVNDATPESFYLFAVDQNEQKTAQGSPSFKVKGETMTSVGSWIKPEVDAFDLAPFETKSIKLTISVPANTEHKLYEGGISLQNKQTSKQGVIVFSVRHIIKSSVLVTDTPVFEQKTMDTFPPTQLYFWASAIIFAIYIGSTTLRPRLRKK